MESDPKITLPTPYSKLESKLNALKMFAEQFKDDKEYNDDYFPACENMIFIYLFRKYNSKCFLRDTRSSFIHMGISLDLRIYKKEKQEIEEAKLHIDVIADGLVNCINKNIETVIIPLSIVAKGGHANILVYRKKFNHIEHFEPHGKELLHGNSQYRPQIEKLNKLLKYFVSTLNTKLKRTEETKIKFIESTKVCPRIVGFQAMENRSRLPTLPGEPFGYCQVWSYFFTELCLSNPEIPSSELLSYVYNILDSMKEDEQNKYMKYMIRGYSIVMNEIAKKYFSLLYSDGKIQRKYHTKLNMPTSDTLSAFISIEMNVSTNPNYVNARINHNKNKINDYYSINKKNEATTINFGEFQHLKKELEILELYKQFDEIKSDTPNDKRKEIPKIAVQPKTDASKTTVCPEGKEINPKTGRCIKIKTLKKTDAPKTKTLKTPDVSKITVCPEGKEINPKTGRCIKTKTLKKTDAPKTDKIVCPEGKEINPKTGRCIKIKTLKKTDVPKTIKICPPGKIINLKTGRCIKAGDDYSA